MNFAERFRQDKTVTPSGSTSFADKFRQETKNSYQASAETRKMKEEKKKKDDAFSKSIQETEKYLQEYNDATSGFAGSVLKRFGAGVSAPVLSSASPVTKSPAYAQAQSLGAENDANLNKSILLNFREGARKIFTENTADTIYDIFYQEGVDEESLKLIENNTKNIIELSRRNKEESNPEFQKRRQVAIDSLIEQNRKTADEVGGKIKNKTNLQLAGQSLGTVLELLPFTVGAGMTTAGKIVLQAGTKQAMKALGKEAALFGAATGASGAAKEEGATVGDIAKSGALGAGLGVLTVAFPGLAKAAVKWGDKKITTALEKLTGKTSDKMTPEDTLIVKEITESGTKKSTESTKTYEVGQTVRVKAGEKEISGTIVKDTGGDSIIVKREDNSSEAVSRAQILPDDKKQEATTLDTAPKKTSGYAESVKAKAIEKEMEDSFQDLAEYTPAVRKEQARMAADLINGDIERVGRMLDGIEELPSGLRGSSLAKAVEMYALKNKDTNLIQKLVRSKISSTISESGSELSMLVGRNPRSPLKLARDIIKSRADNLKKRLKGKKVSAAKKEVRENIKKSLKKEAPTKETWTSFIQDIKC